MAPQPIHQNSGADPIAGDTSGRRPPRTTSGFACLHAIGWERASTRGPPYPLRDGFQRNADFVGRSGLAGVCSWIHCGSRVALVWEDVTRVTAPVCAPARSGAACSSFASMGIHHVTGRLHSHPVAQLRRHLLEVGLGGPFLGVRRRYFSRAGRRLPATSTVLVAPACGPSPGAAGEHGS